MTPDIADERDRCAFIAEDLARRWRASATKIRKEGERRGLFGGRYTDPKWERVARDIEAGAAGLDAVAYCIRRGYDIPERKPYGQTTEAGGPAAQREPS